MNNGSFLVQLTGKLIFAYVKSLVTVILLVPHCRLIHQQWGMFVTNVEQGKNNTFTFPIAFKNNLYFYWAFDYTGYFYNLIIKNKDINSCYIYGAYPNGTEQTGELAPTGVSGISVFIGS